MNHGGCPEQTSSSETPLPTPPPFTVFVRCGCQNKKTMVWGEGWGLNNRNLLSHHSGGRKSKIRLPAGFGSGESSLPGLHMAAFSLCPHVAQTLNQLSGVSYYKDTSLSGSGPQPYDLILTVTSLEAPSPNTVTLGVGVLTIP